jgi:hydrogenase nickel incorporation protein HypA/HybF
MHEFSIAQSIVETVIKVAQDNGASQILEVNLEVGEVALVNVDQLGWHIQMLTQGTLAQGAQLNWSRVPAAIRCEGCGYEGGLRYEREDPSWHFSMPSFECPRCDSPKTVITHGRELRIKEINARFDQAEEGGKPNA